MHLLPMYVYAGPIPAPAPLRYAIVLPALTQKIFYTELGIFVN